MYISIRLSYYNENNYFYYRFAIISIALIPSLSEKYAIDALKYILEKGRIKKTDLLEIITSSWTLDKLIPKLERDGLLEVKESTMGRRTYEISLTPKGRQVAEELRNMDRINKRKSLELQPIFKLILFINEKGECKLSELKDEFPGSYSYIEDLKAEGIIEASIDNSKFPSETIISLKEKGKLIAQKLKELEEILKV